MRLAAFGLLLAVLTGRPAGADSILYATAATPGRIDGYCVTENGGLQPTPVVQVPLGGDTQPRRLFVADGILYVALVNRVLAYRIGQSGGLRHLGGTKAVQGLQPRDIVVDAGRRMLYVPDRSHNRVVGHPLDESGSPEVESGTPAREFTTCIQGPFGSLYQNLALGPDKLYVSAAGGTGAIQVFGLAPDGKLFGADGMPLDRTACTKEKKSDPTPSSCSQKENAEFPCTTPLSQRRQLTNIKTFVIANNVLYAEDKSRRRIRSFLLLPDGNFTPPIVIRIDEETEAQKKKWQPVYNQTDPVVQYENIVHHRNALLGSHIFRGRLDSYALDSNGRLPAKVTAASEEDLRQTPVRLAADGNTLYVSGGELNRIAAYRLDDRGALASTTPFSLTDELDDSYPNDVAIAVLSSRCGSPTP